MEKGTYHEVESHYTDKLNIIREEIIASVKSALEWLGGKVCLGYYHNERNFDRYTFFECDDDGYGVELYIDTIEDNGNGNIEIHLSNSEDCYCPVWGLSDLNMSETLYLLRELESVISYVQETGEKVVTEYDADYEPEEE